MITLGIDTSSDVRVGVAREGVVLASGSIADARAHAEQLMPLVTRVLAEAGIVFGQVERVGVGVGPGPFTGLRVGVVTAASLALAVDVPITGVCSLDVVARAWSDVGAPERFAVVSDARRKEVYWAVYGADGVRLEGPHVTAPADVPDLPLAGPGAHLVEGVRFDKLSDRSDKLSDRPGERFDKLSDRSDKLSDHSDERFDKLSERSGSVAGPVEAPGVVDAGVLAARLDALADAGLEPLYLRRPDAEAPKALKSTLPPVRLSRVR